MIRLFANIYKDADPRRDAELAEAFAGNLANRGLSYHGIEGRPTFDDIFAAANRLAEPDDVSIVANADITFEAIDVRLFEQIGDDEAFALTRWEISPYGPKIFSDDNGAPRIDSQDAWAWRGKCKVTGADFLPGVRGCDNHLTYLFHKAGYKVSNPSLSIIATHLHSSDVRRYGHEPGDCVPKPYLLVPPHRLGEQPQLDLRF